MADQTDTSADERIQTLIRERNQARSDLQEARAQIAELTEQQTAIKAEAERVAASGRAELEAKVATMEAQLRRGSRQGQRRGCAGAAARAAQPRRQRRCQRAASRHRPRSASAAERRLAASGRRRQLGSLLGV